MAGLFDDIPVASSPVYGPGSAYSNTPATDPQAAYATAGAPYRDASAPAGTATNPSYDTPDRSGSDALYHVNPQGQLSDPSPEVNLFGDIPLTEVSKLAHTPQMQRAISAAQGQDYNQPDLSAPFMNSVLYNFMPEVAGAHDAVGAAASNVIHQLRGEPMPYGASDAYSAARAIQRDNLGAVRADHPGAALGAELLGGVINPVNRLGMGYVRAAMEAPEGARLATAMGRSALVSAPIGAVYGAGANPDDRLGGAAEGAAAGAGIGYVAPLAGAALAGTGRAVANGARRAVAGPLATLGDALHDVTAEQMQRAQAIRRDMAARGVNVTLPEAVQQATNNGTALGTMQRILESTRRGEQILAPYLAPRTQQVQGAVGQFADTIAPGTANPSMIGPRGQAAAQGSLDSVRQGINEQARPYYEAMADESGGARYIRNNRTGQTRYVAGPGQAIPEEAFRPLASNTAYQESLAQVRGDPLLNDGISHLPDNNVGVMNEVVKQLDRNATGSAQTMTNPAGNNRKAGLYSEARHLADAIATEHSPQWRAARDIVATGRAEQLNPLEVGPLGGVASADQVAGQTAALYPAKPLAGAHPETATAVRALNGQDAGVADALTRQHLLNSLDQSRPELNGGANPYLGPAFAVKVAGTPERQAVLRAGVSALPEGAAKVDDLDRLLEGLRAMGKRQPAGSKTAFNVAELQNMGVTPAVKFLQSINIAEPLEPLAKLISAVNYRRNMEGLTSFITSAPEDTAGILARARAAAPANLGQVQIPGVVNGAVAAQPALDYLSARQR